MAEESYYGTSREEEEAKYHEINRIARSQVEKMRASVGALAAELHELREVYDADEKEGLAQWFNTDSRFKEVRQELKRAERAKNKPYFGRIDYMDTETGSKSTHYIGKAVIYENPADIIVIDWRAPIASIYYDQKLGVCRFLVPDAGAQEVRLDRKRTYELDEHGVRDFYDSEVVANDDLLTKYLSKSSRNVLGEIIATIQQEQNEVIRINPHHNVLIQGSAGSGKTTVAMHRISYILYNYEREFSPADFYIVGSNKMLLNYITGVLPDLDVYDIGQMTMEELFVRLLYEEWDSSKYKIKKHNKKDPSVGIKGTKRWADDLEEFCVNYVKAFIPKEDIIMEKNGHVIMPGEEIEGILRKMAGRTIYDIYDRLNDVLISHFETELFGRGLSYSSEEQKKLYRKYQNYFTRKKIKHSVFDLYEQFVTEEAFKLEGQQISYDRYNTDLYDLSSLAYIYKALKETEVIREASHVVIDEAQDFGIAAYRSLKYCLSKCTFTIMGDVSQNINFGCGLSDWEELKKVMLPDEYDYFGLLKKSYRNTIEISNFANDILRHGTFAIYPVEPIIRHGKEVNLCQCDTREDIAAHIKQVISGWKDEYETIALICKDEDETREMYVRLQAADLAIPVNAFDEDNLTLENGLTVLPIEYSKGLEFDAVIISDASKNAYPKEDGYAKLLYVAATRALHELEVCYIGELTGLISDPIPEDRKNATFAVDTFHKKARVFAPDERTRAEKARDQSKIGDSEKALRDKYGPKKVEVAAPSSVKRFKRVYVHEVKKIEGGALKPGVAEAVARRAEEKRQANEKLAEASKAAEQKKASKPVSKIQLQNIKTEFGTVPEGNSLLPLGHGKIDTSVKWVDVQKDRVLITSFYGVLSIIPVNNSCARILFAKSEVTNVRPTPHEILIEKNVSWKCNQLRDKIEIVLGKLQISIDKRSGCLTFISSQSGELVSESPKLARQYHDGRNLWWNYFTFCKKEIIKAAGTDGNWIDVSGTAKYVSSSDNKELNATTVIMSMKGYRIMIPAGKKILLNTIQSYSPYIRYENATEIDYFFQVVR